MRMSINQHFPQNLIKIRQNITTEYEANIILSKNKAKPSRIYSFRENGKKTKRAKKNVPQIYSGERFEEHAPIVSKQWITRFPGQAWHRLLLRNRQRLLQSHNLLCSLLFRV